MAKKRNCTSCSEIAKAFCDNSTSDFPCIEPSKHKRPRYRTTAEIVKALTKIESEHWKEAEYYEPSAAEERFYANRQQCFTLTSAMYVPHKGSYRSILSKIDVNDIIMDAGAGDFRLAIMMAAKSKKVYAIEINPTLVQKAIGIIGFDLPLNLFIVCGDFNQIPVPSDVTKIVCLANGAIFPPIWKGKEILSDRLTD
jgi:hypothetical protein